MKPDLTLACRRCGSCVGTARVLMGEGGAILEVTLADPEVCQRLVLPLTAFGALLDLVHAAARRAADPHGTEGLRPASNALREIARMPVLGFAHLIAFAVTKPNGRSTGAAIVNAKIEGCVLCVGRNDRTDQELTLDLGTLDDVVHLLDDARRAAAGLQTESRGVVGHA
jgi:hypothetical protein